MRVQELLQGAGLSASIEPGTVSDLDEMAWMRQRIDALDEADPDTTLRDWEDLAADLLNLENPLPSEMESRLRAMIEESKQTRRTLL